VTTVRGNASLRLTQGAIVEGNNYTRCVVIRSGGWSGPAGREALFQVHGELSIECARELVKNLRRAMRKIRDESHDRLSRAVTEAEGPL
jgi:hypothetical protein